MCEGRGEREQYVRERERERAVRVCERGGARECERGEERREQYARERECRERECV